MTVAWVLANSDHGPMIVNRLDYNQNHSGLYGVGAQIMANGAYDPRDVECFKDLLKVRREYNGDGVVAIDCGANIGVHTVEWARLMRGWGSVLAIEAQERVFYALAGNLVLHNAYNARAMWAAVSDEPGWVEIPEPDYTKPASFGSFELKQRLGTEDIGQPIDYDKPTLKVQTLILDRLRLPRVDLIKIDVEGMEMEALAGAEATIGRCKPILHVEAIKVDRGGLRKRLERLGYRIYLTGMNFLAVHKDDQTNDHLTMVQEAV